MMYDTLRANTEMYKRMLRQSLHCPFKIQYATLNNMKWTSYLSEQTTDTPSYVALQLPTF